MEKIKKYDEEKIKEISKLLLSKKIINTLKRLEIYVKSLLKEFLKKQIIRSIQNYYINLHGYMILVKYYINPHACMILIKYYQNMNILNILWIF